MGKLPEAFETGRGSASRFRFLQAPQRIYWELTRACDLACRHCRAEAIPWRDVRELTPGEARGFLTALREFGDPAPHLVLTGGDPLKRPDFWDLLAHGVALGLGMSVAPSGTPTLTSDVVQRFKATGATAMSLSLDGSDPARHDGFRGVPGCFERTLAAGHAALSAGLTLQINTLVTTETVPDLPAIAEVIERLGAGRWSLFFLIEVGRGRGLGQLGPALCEQVLTWLWRRAGRTSAAITTTEAPHYRRVALQGGRVEDGPRAGRRLEGLRRGFGIRDGNGIMFVSHTGDVQPSGFLPLTAGNVRTARPVDVYRRAPLFRRLRETDGFGGRCGRCEFREICGGSRARAFAATGDPMAEDPLCAYTPGGSGRGVA
jgi:radical SAM protein